MKRWNWLSFIAGILIGALLTAGIAFYIGNKVVSEKGGVPGLTMLKEGQKGSSFDTKSIKVMQTLSPKMALAHTGKIGDYTKEMNYYGTLVLYIAEDNVSLYDDMIINIPEGKRLEQIGTFEYETKNKTMKTVPAVSIK